MVEIAVVQILALIYTVFECINMQNIQSPTDRNEIAMIKEQKNVYVPSFPSSLDS